MKKNVELTPEIIKAVYNDIIPESEWNKTYFEKMDFFGADLYVTIPEKLILHSELKYIAL